MDSFASQSIPSWNRIITWLKEMETLQEESAGIVQKPVNAVVFYLPYHLTVCLVVERE